MSMKIGEEYSFKRAKGSLSQWLYIWLVLLIIGVGMIVTANLRKMQREAEAIAKNYVTDVSKQVAGEVRLRIDMTVEELEALIDGALHLKSDSLSDMLSRKKGLMDFKKLGISGRDGIITFDDGTKDIQGEYFSSRR